jgi:glycosyltransferase involved in cell wall biosynthesis
MSGSKKAIQTDKPRVMILASGDLWAGAEVVVYELCKGLKEHTPVDVTAVFLNEGVLASRCREHGVTTHVIDEKRHGLLSLTRKVIDLVDRTHPHIIHAHRYKENIIAFLAKGFTFSNTVCLLSTVHGRFEHQDGWKIKGLKMLNALILRHAFSAVVAVSQDLMSYLRKDFRIPEYKIRCVINGIGVVKEQRTNLMTGDMITIGSAGRLTPVKDYPLMVDVARELCSLKDNVRFYLAGDGPDKQRLQEQINEYGLREKFILLGHVQDMDGFYRSVDIYMNTSRHEGMPVTILEAMSSAIPIVAPSVGGLKELISSGKDGVLVDERSARSFADALCRVIEDGEAARSMGMRARQKIEREFSSGKMVQEYYSLYMSLL